MSNTSQTLHPVLNPVLPPLSFTGVNDCLVPSHSPYVYLHFQHIATCDLCKKAIRLYQPPLNLRLFHVFTLIWRETLHPFSCSFPTHLPLRSSHAHATLCLVLMFQEHGLSQFPQFARFFWMVTLQQNALFLASSIVGTFSSVCSFWT